MAKAVNPTSPPLANARGGFDFGLLPPFLPLQMQGEAQEGFSTGIFNFKLVHYRHGV
jgi:hypothetical protein